jgi:hypothetical protein
VGAGAQVTRGGPGAASSYGDTWRPRSCPEPGDGSQSRGDAWKSQNCPQPGGGSRSRCLNLKLARGGGVPGPQSTDSGSQAHPRRGCEPASGANIPFSCSLSESCTLGFRSGGAARLISGNPPFARTLRCSARNCHTPQLRVGRYCSAEVTGTEAIMTTIPELMGRRTYGMHGDSVSALLHHHFAVQCRLMNGTWARLSAPGYAERGVGTKRRAR